MDIQLQELIDKIKKDGIESASEEALRLTAQAEGEAKRIVDAARRDAADIIAKGKADADRAEKAGTAALEQASRNLILAFKKEIETLLDKIIALKTEAVYTDEVLKGALPEILKNWASRGSDSLDVLLSEKDRKALEGYFTGKLAAELPKGVELKTDRNLGAGFRIAEKDGSAYYDFSAESVAELLAAYLNPRLAEILKRAVKDN
ncbi:MAG: V-type ATP synthase subunit E [Spirochaetaceae bacterium]|jgi:V/A-type H+-transporting ATPase subunit E|nr:V-type ATP synthase subunit E [Spirochaetaceae bacterium]